MPLWPKPKPPDETKREIPLIQDHYDLLLKVAVQTLVVLRELRKELKMDFTALNSAISQLATDVSKEVADAQAAIIAAQGGDPTALAAAVTALQNIDAAVQAADASFQPAGTSTATGTSTVPTPPSV